MAIEIERKFLVRDESWKAQVVRFRQLRQAYLAVGGNVSTRVRIDDSNNSDPNPQDAPVWHREARIRVSHPGSRCRSPTCLPCRIDYQQEASPRSDRPGHLGD